MDTDRPADRPHCSALAPAPGAHEPQPRNAEGAKAMWHCRKYRGADGPPAKRLRPSVNRCCRRHRLPGASHHCAAAAATQNPPGAATGSDQSCVVALGATLPRDHCGRLLRRTRPSWAAAASLPPAQSVRRHCPGCAGLVAASGWNCGRGAPCCQQRHHRRHAKSASLSLTKKAWLRQLWLHPQCCRPYRPTVHLVSDSCSCCGRGRGCPHPATAPLLGAGALWPRHHLASAQMASTIGPTNAGGHCRLGQHGCQRPMG